MISAVAAESSKDHELQDRDAMHALKPTSETKFSSFLDLLVCQQLVV